MEIGGMSLGEFERSHTMAELEEIAAMSHIRRQEKDTEDRIKRVEASAQRNRSG